MWAIPDDGPYPTEPAFILEFPQFINVLNFGWNLPCAYNPTAQLLYFNPIDSDSPFILYTIDIANQLLLSAAPFVTF